MARWISVDDEMDRWSITSERLRFFKIGFFVGNDSIRERLFGSNVETDTIGVDVLVCKGPYNQVTS